MKKVPQQYFEVDVPASTSPEFQYLNTDRAAAFLCLSRETLAFYRCLGKGPAFRKVGRRVLYRINDLSAWAESGGNAAPSEAA